jgi:actin-related protein 8
MATMRNAVKQIFLPPAIPTTPARVDPATEADTDVSRANSPKPAPPPQASEYPDQFVELNSGKVPLDIAIVESLASAGTEERIKRFSSSIIVVGGTAKLTGMAWALQSRSVPPLLAFEWLPMRETGWAASWRCATRRWPPAT